MKEERMVVLGLLEKGIISAEEAERLLMALQSTSSSTREGVGAAVGSALNKAGSALNGVAKTLSEKAGKLEPKVKEVADKVSEKASVIVDDAKTYAEKLRNKREKEQEEDWEDCDMDFQDIWGDDEPMKEIEKEELATEEAPNPYIKSLEGYMNTMQEQMDQINTAENFLKEAFGMEGEDFMDEEEIEEEPETEKEPLKEPEAIQEQLVLEETAVDEDKKED